MFERSERVLKIICLGIAVLLICQLVIAVFRHNPLEHASIPVLPSLTSPADEKAGPQGTNSIAAKTTAKTGTNSAAAETAGKAGTNSTSVPGAETKGTNAASNTVSNQTATNVSVVEKNAAKGTNSVTAAGAEKEDTNAIATGARAGKKGTNAVTATNAVAGTNASGRNKRCPRWRRQRRSPRCQNRAGGPGQEGPGTFASRPVRALIRLWTARFWGQ